MSNSYSAPTLTGYNANEPADPQKTDTYTKSWANHKVDLHDPIKTYLDAIKSALSTAFARVPLYTYEDKSDNYTITTADKGKVFCATVTGKTFTLPAAASAGANFMVGVKSVVATCTIDGNSSETIDGSTTLSLTPGEWAILVCDGSAWRALTVAGQAAAARRVYTNTAGFSEAAGTYTDVISNVPVNPSTWYKIKLFAEVDGGGGFGVDFQLSYDGTTGQNFGGWSYVAEEAGSINYDNANASESWSALDNTTSFGDLANCRVVVEGYYMTGSDASLVDVQAKARGATSTATTIDIGKCAIVLEEIK